MNTTNEELLEKLMHLEVLMHRLHSFNMRERGPLGNPHRGQGRVLSILKMQPQISQKELGYLLDMRNQSLGELLAKLEQKGYITKTPSEEDRRTAVIRLTEEGAAAAEDSKKEQPDSEQFFDTLSDEEKEQFCNYLSRLIETLKGQMKDAGQDEHERFMHHRGGAAFGRGLYGRDMPHKDIGRRDKRYFEMDEDRRSW